MLTAEPTPTLLYGLAQLVSALAWPALAAVLVFVERKPLRKLIAATVNLAESANKIKLSIFEVERQISKEVSNSAQIAASTPVAAITSSSELRAAARRVEGLLAVIPESSAKEIVIFNVKESMESFAREYESTRATMTRGPQRTLAMNAIAAKMRTLAIAARPFLAEFSASPKSGKRLAAICILEVSPNFKYLDWLVDRMRVETPFVFFHASLALSELVSRSGNELRQPLEAAATRALNIIQSFEGTPDPNTVSVLEGCLRYLRGIEHNNTASH